MTRFVSRCAAAIGAATLLVLALPAVSSGQTQDDFDLTIEITCDTDDTILLNFTFTNNYSEPVDLQRMHFAGGDDVVFSPVNVPAGGTSTGTYDTGQNPYTSSFTFDAPMLINGDVEFQAFFDFTFTGEACPRGVPTTTTSTTLATTTTAAPVPTPVPATPTYTG